MERGGREVGGGGGVCAVPAPHSTVAEGRREMYLFHLPPSTQSADSRRTHFPMPCCSRVEALGATRQFPDRMAVCRRPQIIVLSAEGPLAAAAGVRLFDPRNSLHRQSSRRCQVDTLLAWMHGPQIHANS